jgi:pyruvate formate lyase activating enzyme
VLCKKGSFPIKGFIETSFIDWKGCLSSVIFSGGCNFRCPFCHNSNLVLHHNEVENIPLDYIIPTLKKYRDWVDRVVITGGEPTIHGSLLETIKEIKKEGILVKLDSNGSSPSVLKMLANEGLIDYIAMDVKGPLTRYERWCGVKVDIEKIEESIQFIMESHIDYEFRMTVVPFFHRDEDVYEVAEYIRNAKRFYIQEFQPKNTLNPSFSNITPFSLEKVEKIRVKVSQILTNNNQCSQCRSLE